MADTDYLAASDGTGNAALMHVTTPRSIAATIIQVDTVSGVPAFFIGTYGTLGSDGFITAASARDFFGHVNAGTLVIDKHAPGNTDTGNTTGQVVVIKPSTPTQNLVGNFIKSALNLFGEGQLLNGKLVPSISSNNLIVAIKTLNGVDPSTSDVVYVRIGGTVRSITAPLSVTLAAGTNWFSKGTAPFAAAASNFFVYLGFNATDGVVLGVSSTGHAVRYSDFSTTNTDFTYAKISTTTNAAATDTYETVGYFNAILGVSATYLWTLPAAGSSTIVTQPLRAPLTSPVRFSVYRNAALNAGSNPTIFDSKLFDLSNNYNTATGLFTAPVAGLYQFTAMLQETNPGITGWAAWLNKNGVQQAGGFNTVTTSNVGNPFGWPISRFFQLAAGDTVSVGNGGTTAPLVVGAANNCFEGFLVNAL